MKRYSVQPRDRIFVKGYGFLSFAKNVGRSVGKNISKILSGKYCQKLLDHAKNLLQMYLKLLQKEQFKKQQKKLAIWFAIQLLIKSQKSQKFYHIIIQKQVQMKKKDIYLQKKNS